LFVAMAAQFQQAAFERTRGVFTRVLLGGLRGGAHDASGRLTASALKLHLDKHVPLASELDGCRQYPEVSTSFPEAEPLHELGAAARASATQVQIRIAFTQPRFQHHVVVESPRLEELFSARVTQPAHEMTLEPGLYLLRDRDTGEDKPLRVQPLPAGAAPLTVEF
jgi:hypothetical protein